jgi:hypothetical protein
VSWSRTSRRVAALGVGLALALTAVAAAEAPTSLLGFDGHRWKALSEKEKMGLLTGFLIGGALVEGMGAAPLSADAPAPETLEALRRQSRLRFSFAPNVYKARLEDFYFYEDRLSVPFYRALLLINEQIQQDATRGR